MFWKIAADVVVVIHLLWIVFIIFGALVGRKYTWVKWLHLGALGFSLLLQVFQGICPLTYLEIWLRHRHDPSLAYAGDFIAHYAEQLVYLRAPREWVLAITVGVVVVTLLAYWPRILRFPKLRSS